MTELFSGDVANVAVALCIVALVFIYAVVVPTVFAFIFSPTIVRKEKREGAARNDRQSR